MASPPPTTPSALQSALGVLLGVSRADSISLWRGGDDGPQLIAGAGDVDDRLYEIRETAAAGLADRPVIGAPVSVVAVDSPGMAAAVLIAHDCAGGAGVHDTLLRASRPALASLLQRATNEGEDVAAAAERRLARLRYDLHDGPQQDVHLLAQDLRLFREQLTPMVAGHPHRDRALGRLDDLEAQLIALDDQLRRLLTSAGSTLIAPGSLGQSLVAVAEAFTVRTGIVPRTELSGDVESLTESQRIALVSLVRESLSNVHQHSDADNVAITVTAGEDAIVAEVRDDGGGFDPARDGSRAAAAGHLGLVGMRERMRMLGGRTEIESTPGGGTVITATLPRWPVDPVAAG